MSVFAKNLENGRYFEITEENKGRVHFYPVGGGFTYSLPSETFEAQFERVENVPVEFEAALFEIDEVCGPYAGFHNPNYRWNGWEVPRFEKEVARQIVADLQSMDGGHDCYYVDFENGIVLDKQWIDRDSSIETVLESKDAVDEANIMRIGDDGLYIFEGWCWDTVLNTDEDV